MCPLINSVSGIATDRRASSSIYLFTLFCYRYTAYNTSSGFSNKNDYIGTAVFRNIHSYNDRVSNIYILYHIIISICKLSKVVSYPQLVCY